MKNSDWDRMALRFSVYTLAVFAAMMALALATGGAGAQEPHEVFAAPAAYTQALLDCANNLRIVLFLDVLFMIGYGGALAMTARAFAANNPVMAWVAGLGAAGLIALDIREDVFMVISLDMAEAGVALEPARIAAQAGISGVKWLIAALSVVALSFVLPQETGLERVLVWSARLALPVGAGLFVTGAFDARVVGGVLILTGMGGGFTLLAVTAWLRQRR